MSNDNTEQERAFMALSAEIEPDTYSHDAKSIIRGLRQRGYVLVERALVVAAADNLDPSCSNTRLLALASRLRRAAAAGNGEGT